MLSDVHILPKTDAEPPMNYLKAMKIDVFCFLFSLAVGVSSNTVILIVQDKICRNDHGLSWSVCGDIQQEGGSHYSETIDIYKQVTQWQGYSVLVCGMPGIIVTLFAGRWLDKYPMYMKYALASPAIGSFIGSLLLIYQLLNFKMGKELRRELRHLEGPFSSQTPNTYIMTTFSGYMSMLYTFLPYSLMGGTALYLCAVFAYVSRLTPPRYRMIRFGMVEFALTIGKL